MVGSILVGCVMPPSQYYSSPYSRYYPTAASSSASTRYYSDPSAVSSISRELSPAKPRSTPYGVENVISHRRSPQSRKVPGQMGNLDTAFQVTSHWLSLRSSTASAPNACPAGWNCNRLTLLNSPRKENKHHVVRPRDADVILTYEKQLRIPERS
jgi:hypothetical protein